MRNLITISILLFTNISNSQEFIGRRYTLFNELKFCESENSKLVKEEYKPYEKLSKPKRDKINLKLKLLEEGLSKEMKFNDINGNEIIVNPDMVKSYDYRKIIALKDVSSPDFIIINNIKKFVGNILFEKDKIYVNPWNYINEEIKDDETEIYYKLKDGQTAGLYFKELTLSTFTMPLKIRFGGKSKVTKRGINEQTMRTIIIDTLNNIDATFSSGFNVALFFGQSFGKTNLNHRNKIGNRITTHKHTIGGFIGTSAQTLTTSNTDGTLMEDDFKDRTIGLLSIGGGYIYSRNKFGIGVFAGWDLGIGELANIWDYNGRPYFGIGLGIDVFKVQT
ncbi:hypothetical protein [uncultured Maribacter sp.]|uniref:hypothetical protein n=1 Tax=uncultured Maribacter sp. TaxID=431308 RepID=UPI0026241C6B|nr:hypothetical protein [uncultured Maribacter sp.]